MFLNSRFIFLPFFVHFYISKRAGRTELTNKTIMSTTENKKKIVAPTNTENEERKRE